MRLNGYWPTRWRGASRSFLRDWPLAMARLNGQAGNRTQNIFHYTMLKIIFTLILAAKPVLVVAGMDQPWNDSDGYGGGSGGAGIGLLIAIIYFYLVIKIPPLTILIPIGMVAYLIISKLLGVYAFGLAGIAIVIWFVRTKRRDKEALGSLSSQAQETNEVHSAPSENLDFLRRMEEGDSVEDIEHCKGVDESISRSPSPSRKKVEMSSVLPCPSCGQTLRVPSDKLLDIRCPKCQHNFRKFT